MTAPEQSDKDEREALLRRTYADGVEAAARIIESRELYSGPLAAKDLDDLKEYFVRKIRYLKDIAPVAPAEDSTPRVEEEVVLIPVGVEGLEAEFVHAEFARQLQRELIVATHNAKCFKALYRDAEATIERQALSLEAGFASTVSARPLTERALMGLGVLDNVDKLLTERGYQEDSSTRHQLSIARGILKEELEAAALSTKSRSTYRCTICGVEYLEALSATTERKK